MEHESHECVNGSSRRQTYTRDEAYSDHDCVNPVIMPLASEPMTIERETALKYPDRNKNRSVVRTLQLV